MIGADVGATLGAARLDGDFDELHRVIPTHLFTQSIQRFPVAECILM
jgi:hypothetical protein